MANENYPLDARGDALSLELLRHSVVTTNEEGTRVGKDGRVSDQKQLFSQIIKSVRDQKGAFSFHSQFGHRKSQQE